MSFPPGNVFKYDAASQEVLSTPVPDFEQVPMALLLNLAPGSLQVVQYSVTVMVMYGGQ